MDGIWYIWETANARRAQEDWIVKWGWPFFKLKVQNVSGTDVPCKVKNMGVKLSDMTE